MRQPIWKQNIPWCDESCEEYDGKRCYLLGFRPCSICEPEVRAIVKRLKHLEKRKELGL